MNFPKKLLVSAVISLSLFSITNAETSSITRKEAFIFFAVQHIREVPESFQYIDLKYTDVEKDSKLEDALQILVYLNLINNTETALSPNKKISLYTFEKLSEKILKISVSEEQDWINKKAIPVTATDLQNIENLLSQRDAVERQTIKINSSIGTQYSLGKKWEILLDVYKTLLQEHYDRDDLDTDHLIESAISWLAQWADDKYTSYFPPTESGEFFETLDGEYEGIGAYVDMVEAWVFIIVSPMVGSPAEAAWLKWGDRVTHVDGKQITDKNSVKEVVSWIKGEAGSYVTLTILREWVEEAFDVDVKREKIILHDVEYETLDRNTFYIQVKNFGDKVDSEFEEALNALKEETSIKKIIIDVRNNPGWYLGKVSNMLSYFVEKGQATAIINYGENEIEYKSLGKNIVNFSEYEVILLQNGGSASASEIMVWTIKDYFPEVTIIWEQSFWKGSVQTLKNYYDGSTLKYTAAKWFTGNTKQGIDGVGITPDIYLEFDDERWDKYKKDNQLEKALDL